MRNFKDKDGQIWGVEITLPVLRRVKRDTEINLMEVMLDNAALMVALEQDPVMFSEVLWAICQPQAEERQLSRDEFELRVFDTGDRVQQALLRVLEATADFFPSQEKKTALAWIAAGVEIQDKMSEANQKTIEEKRKETLKSLKPPRKKRSASTSDAAESSQLTPTA